MEEEGEEEEGEEEEGEKRGGGEERRGGGKMEIEFISFPSLLFGVSDHRSVL